jgi:UDP-N-acetylmuramoylalanine-D-glutamate ligase
MKEYMEKTIRRFAGKRILVWGYGREGRSTEKLLKEYCSPEVVDIYEGSREGVEEDLYDYVFVSPGIKFEEDAPDFRNEKFTSQTEIFMEEYGAQTVGITGTKGKSTTGAMLAAVLSACTTGRSSSWEISGSRVLTICRKWMRTASPFSSFPATSASGCRRTRIRRFS